MVSAFNDRLMTLDVQLVDANGASQGDVYTFNQDLYMLATGTHFTDGSLGECAIRVDNIAKQTRDFLVAKTSPWIIPRVYANITLSVGRKNTGTFILFTGQATASNPSQPPDIGLTFTALTGAASLGNLGAFSAGGLITLKDLSLQVANSIPNPSTGKPGIPLDYQATYNPQIANYSFNGAWIRQVEKLNTMGGISATVHNNVLMVNDFGRQGNQGPIMLNKDTGMIGVPEVTDLGITARMLIGPEIKPFQQITVKSQLNPAANGTFWANKIGYTVASRDPPFYWELDLRANVLGDQS